MTSLDALQHLTFYKLRVQVRARDRLVLPPYKGGRPPWGPRSGADACSLLLRHL
jgi:hypothetical protein